MLYKKEMVGVRKLASDFRRQHPNYGCHMCKSYVYSWATPQEIMDGFIEKRLCPDCVLYKMYLKLKEYEERYVDDGR